VTSFAAVSLVATRELRARIMTRSFLIITMLIMLLSAGSVAAIDLLPALFEKGPKHLGVTEASASGDALQQELTQSAAALGIDVTIARFPDRPSGEAALRDGEVDALLTEQDELVFESTEDQSLSAVVNRALYTRSLPGVLEKLGLSYEDVRPLVEPSGASIRLVNPADAGRKASEDRVIVGQVATIVIFLALVFYGEWLLTGVVEEKTSRVVEVLLAALRPEQLLAGKVLGIVAAAVTQMFSAAVAVGLALVVIGAAKIPAVALDVALISCVFLVLGILSYSFLYATVGATISRQSEANSAQMPIILILLVPYFLSLTAVTDSPDGVLARILSLLPPTAPMAMPQRVATGEPLPIEIIASVVLMVPWLLAVGWLGGRVYAGAILRSGPRVGLLAAWRGAVETRRD
jgi:ABC-2 type transport system permease protein